MRGLYLLSEGLPESCHGCWSKGSAGHTAHHHRKSSSAGAIGLQGCKLAQFTTGQMGFVASAVHRVVPVCGLPPTGKHPGQTGEKERRHLWDDGRLSQVHQTRLITSADQSWWIILPDEWLKWWYIMVFISFFWLLKATERIQPAQHQWTFGLKPVRRWFN